MISAAKRLVRSDPEMARSRLSGAKSPVAEAGREAAFGRGLRDGHWPGLAATMALDWIAALSAKIVRIGRASRFQNGAIERLRDRLPDEEAHQRSQGPHCHREIKAIPTTLFRRML